MSAVETSTKSHNQIEISLKSGSHQKKDIEKVLEDAEKFKYVGLATIRLANTLMYIFYF